MALVDDILSGVGVGVFLTSVTRNERVNIIRDNYGLWFFSCPCIGFMAESGRFGLAATKIVGLAVNI